MTRTGETARVFGEFRCHRCHQHARIVKGQVLPKCPRCGGDGYDAITTRLDFGADRALRRLIAQRRMARRFGRLSRDVHRDRG
jgi:Zinc-ribbon containing domain